MLIDVVILLQLQILWGGEVHIVLDVTIQLNSAEIINHHSYLTLILFPDMVRTKMYALLLTNKQVSLLCAEVTMTSA